MAVQAFTRVGTPDMTSEAKGIVQLRKTFIFYSFQSLAKSVFYLSYAQFFCLLVFFSYSQSLLFASRQSYRGGDQRCAIAYGANIGQVLELPTQYHHFTDSRELHYNHGFPRYSHRREEGHLRRGHPDRARHGCSCRRWSSDQRIRP